MLAIILAVWYQRWRTGSHLHCKNGNISE